MASTMNVREMEHLERQIYQESIDRVRTQHEELLRGSLDDFVQRCAPFEHEKRGETDAALVRLQLNQRNSHDLLEFELKEADDTHTAQREELKQQLLAAARKRLERLERRAAALDNDATTNDDSAPLERKRKRRSRRMDAQQQSPTTTSPTEEPLTTRTALASALERAMHANARAFNLQHVACVLPSATSIAADVLNELERLQDKQTQFAQAAPNAVAVDADVDAQTLTIEATSFRVGDFVILTSQLSDEDFYGQLTAMNDACVAFVLACGTPAHATLAALRSGKCTLVHQKAPRAACMRVDERTIVDTKRIRFESQRKKRGWRKRAVDIRCGF